MLLCLDVGNSHIFGGIFDGEQLCVSFRYPSAQACTSDQVGVFLKGVIRENDIDMTDIVGISICSVVPRLNYSLRSACLKYFKKDPFIMQTGVKTGLRILAKNPREIGADRIANSMGAADQFPNESMIVIDFGTATTFSVISAKKEYLGGPIMPGLRISMESLTANAAMLSPVNIVTRPLCAGQTTASNIQSGLYYGQLGAVREIINQLQQEISFLGETSTLVATGGFSHLFEQEKLFSAISPNLVLQGLRVAWLKNRVQ